MPAYSSEARLLSRAPGVISQDGKWEDPEVQTEGESH